MERTSFSLLSEETDFIPLITNEEDNSIPDSDLQEEISILPLRNTVQFPGVVSPITAGRIKVSNWYRVHRKVKNYLEY